MQRPEQKQQTRVQQLLDLCNYLGFLVNLEKSKIIPTQIFDVVELNFNLVTETVHITKKNVKNITDMALKFSSLSSASSKSWQYLIGTFQAQPQLILFARLKVQPFKLHFAR